MDENQRRSFEERDHFVSSLRAAEMHWFFVQAVQAIDQGLYLPGVVSLLNGIETSVRMTMKQLEGSSLLPASDLGPVLGNPLLRRAGEAGLPVGALAFPEETDFAAKLRANKPGVDLVRVRNDLCHGNVLKFVNEELGEDQPFFTPECLRGLSEVLRVVSYGWAEELGPFREAKLGM